MRQRQPSLSTGETISCCRKTSVFQGNFELPISDTWKASQLEMHFKIYIWLQLQPVLSIAIKSWSSKNTHFSNVLKNTQTRPCFPASPWRIHKCPAVLSHTSRAALLMRNLAPVIFALPSTPAASMRRSQQGLPCCLSTHSTLNSSKQKQTLCGPAENMRVKDRNPAFFKMEQVPDEILMRHVLPTKPLVIFVQPRCAWLLSQASRVTHRRRNSQLLSKAQDQLDPPPSTPNTSSQGYGIWLLPEKHRCCKRQEILVRD